MPDCSWLVSATMSLHSQSITLQSQLLTFRHKRRYLILHADYHHVQILVDSGFNEVKNAKSLHHIPLHHGIYHQTNVCFPLSDILLAYIITPMNITLHQYN